MELIIAEKPSVGNSIAAVVGASERHDGYIEGNNYIVSWCVGHLVGLADAAAYNEKYKKWNREDLPIIPETYKWYVSEDKKKQFSILKTLMQRNDVNTIVCATDAGREGELIFRLVYKMAGCHKPVKRLWISSMEDTAIKDGLCSLRDGHTYDNLYYAALSRCKADWLFGINATRLFSSLYNKRLIVGRVQTPTLAMIVERDQSIKSFEKQKYYNVEVKTKDVVFIKDKIFDFKAAEEIKMKCDGSELTITHITNEMKTINPPKLYDLTTLQREANRYYGYTAEQTLNAAQSLYEKKYITYPRTDSQYLTEDMGDYARSVIITVCGLYDWNGYASNEPDVEQCMDDSQVSDHHALIPTRSIKDLDLKSLRGDEYDILQLIAARLLCATGSKHQYLETNVTAECAGESFYAKGHQIVSEGWKIAERIIKNQDDDSQELLLPDLQEGEKCFPVSILITEHYTSPPKEYTDDSLLAAMERAGNDDFDDDTEKKGLGTPATRATIIEKLIKSHYVVRKGKQLLPTEDGCNLIDIVPESLKSPKLTAEWENSLMKIERGEYNASSFMVEIIKSIRQIIDDHVDINEAEKTRFAAASPQKEIIGTCPRCGMAVYESVKKYYCSNRECGFCIWKESKWLTGMKKKITPGMAKCLLKSGRVHVKGFHSQKKGTTFDADLVLEDTGNYVNFKLDFGNEINKK